MQIIILKLTTQSHRLIDHFPQDHWCDTIEINLIKNIYFFKIENKSLISLS